MRQTCPADIGAIFYQPGLAELIRAKRDQRIIILRPSTVVVVAPILEHQYRAPFTVAVVLLAAIEFRQYVLLAVRYPFTS